MKMLKIPLIMVVAISIIVVTAKVSYAIAQHAANLTVIEATPKDLAEEMQGDNFYGKYPNTMLFVTGKIKNITQNNNHRIVQFETTSKINVLPRVFCDMGNNQSVHTGDTIKVLTVAYYAKRQKPADVALQNCYLLKN